jgi:hypothetical protein
MKRRRRAHIGSGHVAGTEIVTCPDCSARDAVGFTFGHLSRAELEHRASESEAVVSFARSERGKSLTRGCVTCGGTGTIRVPVGVYPPSVRKALPA